MKKRAATPEELRRLERYGVPVEQITAPYYKEYGPQEWLCEDGMPVQELFFVLRGQAKVFLPSENGDNLILCLYDGFGVLDDMELFLEDGVCHVSCRAISRVEGIALPLAENRAALLGSNAFLRATCVSFAGSLRRGRNHFSNLLYPLEERVCSYIAVMERAGRWQDNLSQVAELLGVSYRHLTRTLQGLCEQGVLRKDGHTYWVEDRAALAARAREFVPPTETEGNI